jgi:hypothetical protein
VGEIDDDDIVEGSSAGANIHNLETIRLPAALKKERTEVYLGQFYIPTRGNLFLPVRLLVWADGRGTVAQADSAAKAELQGAPKQKLLQLKRIQKYHWVKHKDMLICFFRCLP